MNKLINKYKALSLPLRATFWFTVCNFAIKGISFICMPLYTRLLPTEEYGRMTVLTSYETIFCIFATFELYLGAYQRGILKFKDDLRTFEQSIVMFSNVLSIICLGIVILFNKPFSELTGISGGFYAVMTIYFLGFTPYSCWLNRKRFDYDYRAAVVVTLLMAVVANLLPILTVNLFGKTAVVKVVSTLVLSSLFCLPFWIRDFRPLNLIRNRSKVCEYAIYAVKFQGPLLLHSLSYYILNQSDRIMIEKFSDGAEVAFYSVAYSLATVIMLVQNSLNQVLKPWRFKKLESGNYADVKKNSSTLIVVVGIVIITFMLIVPEVFKFLFVEEYYQALVCIPPVTMGVFFLFLYTIFVDVESYYGKTNYIAYVSVFCAVFNIILNYFGMKIFSYVICAYTTLVCYAIMSFLHYVFMIKTCRKARIVEIPVDAEFIWTFSLALLLVFGLISFVYDSILARYSILAVVVIIAVLNKNRFIGVLEQARSK